MNENLFLELASLWKKFFVCWQVNDVDRRPLWWASIIIIIIIIIIIKAICNAQDPLKKAANVLSGS